MKFFKKLYLRLSDCDGMCMHCGGSLKEACEEIKSKKLNENERIINFKNIEGVVIDPVYVELMYEDGLYKFYETDCHQKIQEVFPVPACCKKDIIKGVNTEGFKAGDLLALGNSGQLIKADAAINNANGLKNKPGFMTRFGKVRNLKTK